VLVDGFVAGTWELVGKRESTSIRVQPYVRPPRAALDEISAEGNRLLDRAFEVGDPVVEIAS
jgi:Winged helix DNA-binding domain